MLNPERGERGNERDERKKRVLRAGAFQVLWALLLVYLILAGLALLFGPQAGYGISVAVCGGLALLVTVTFAAIHVLDRASAPGTGWMQRFLTRHSDRDLPRKRW